MVDVDGMVGGLVELMEDAHLTAGLSRCSEDGIAEMVFRNHLRTAEREEDAAGLDLLERLVVQAGIAFQGVVQGTAVLGEGGGIEDDQVVLAASLFEVAEGIVAEGLMTLVAGEVQFDVAVGELDGLRAAVDGMDELCPAPHGIKRESTGVTEHIQHPPALGEALEQQAVVALVDEEARLLAAQPVDVEQQSVLHRGIVVRAAVDEVAQRAVVGKSGFIGAHLARQRGLALIVDVGDAAVHHLHQLAGDGIAADVHADAVGLHDGRLAIDVNDQSRQQVALAVHQAVGVVLRIVGQADGQPHLQGGSEATAPERLVDGFVTKGEHPHGDGTHLIVTDSDEIAMTVDDTHHFAFADALVGLLDGPREHPGMEAEQTLLLASFKIDLSHCSDSHFRPA